MSRALTTAEQADVVAERDRIAWNLPRGPVAATKQEESAAGSQDPADEAEHERDGSRP